MTREKKCANVKCQATTTSLWRKGWLTSTGRVWLCNACGLHYRKKHFCQFCNQIYRESDCDDCTNPWIGCARCERWVHIRCEREAIDMTKDYICPECRCSNDSGDASDVRIKRRRKVPKRRASLPNATSITNQWTFHNTAIRKQTSSPKIIKTTISHLLNPTPTNINFIPIIPKNEISPNVPEMRDEVVDNSSGDECSSPRETYSSFNKDELIKIFKRRPSFEFNVKMSVLVSVCEFERRKFDW